jgi:hypothetical protein
MGITERIIFRKKLIEAIEAIELIEYIASKNNLNPQDYSAIKSELWEVASVTDLRLEKQEEEEEEPPSASDEYKEKRENDL